MISRVFQRGIHTVPKLKHNAVWQKAGIDSLYSAEGYKIAWTDYQTYLTVNLSLTTSGTDLEQKNAFQTLLTTGGLNHQTPVFHYASQAHNNDFFFRGLVRNPLENSSVPSRHLTEKINQSFGSLDGLKQELIGRAAEFNNNGWAFVVEKPDKKLEVVLLNNEGSPYFYNRNQSTNLNGPISLQQYTKLVADQENVNSQVRDYTLPLLAISLWDHAYLYDYGVDKKKEYLENAWRAIDWDVVSSRVFQFAQ